MALDTRIAMGVQPLDIGASIGRGYQLRDLAAQSDARNLDAQLKQQAVQKQKTLGDLYRGAIGSDGKIDRAQISQGMANAGYGYDVPAMQKQWSDADKAEADYLQKNREGIMKTLDYSNKAFGSLLAKPNVTSDDVIREISAMTQFGIMTPEQGAQAARTVPGDPNQLRQFLQQKLLQSQQAKDMYAAAMPQLQAVNLGGRTAMVDMNPNTNPGVVGQEYQRTATPGEVEAARHNQAVEGSAAQKASRDQTQIVTDADGGVQLVNKQTGQAQPVTGADGQPVIGKGGLSQEQLKNASSKQQTVTILRKQLENLKAARDKLGTMDYGVVAGRQAVTDSARAYDGALAALQSTVRQLTRTPGEGSMSDYESRIAQAQLPGRVDPAQVIDQKITQLEDLANVIEQGYSSILSKAKGGRQQAAPSGSGGVLTPAQQPQGSAVIEQARQAIANGADPAAVRQRLQSMGIDPRGLGNGNDSRTGSW